MAKKTRTKEIWHIPKRCNAHQTIAILHAIIAGKINTTKWTSQKQEQVSSWLGKHGATRNGRAISHQAIRTLLALPKYLGLIYINEETTPNTILVTAAGKEAVRFHHPFPKVKSLKDPSTIEVSKIIRKQMLKLQITNPIILKDCENIFVFPFRTTLQLLLDLGYLDVQEIGYIVFRNMKKQDEIDLIKKEILQFRKISQADRESLMSAYKKTEIGQLTLVKAPTTLYYISLCKATGICEESSIVPPNYPKKLTTLKLTNKYSGIEKKIRRFLDVFKDSNPFDFQEDTRLWVSYIGNPKRMCTPRARNILLKADNDFECLIMISQESIDLGWGILTPGAELPVPLFDDEIYDINIFDVHQAKLIGTWNKRTIKNDKSKIVIDLGSSVSVPRLTESDYCRLILEICNGKALDSLFGRYVRLLERILKRKFPISYLRGARLEYLFSKLLGLLEQGGKIQDLVWNGKLAQYGLPRPAPGGKHGIPDIVFKLGSTIYVLELTTIIPRALQWSAEGASVPDHIRNIITQHGTTDVVGIFAAPIQHKRNINALKGNLKSDNIKILCIEIEKLLELLNKKDIQKEISSAI